MSGIIEMRTYRTKPGMRERVMDLLVERSFPVLRQIGMTVLGPFPSVEDPDIFFWMRGFPDLAARARMRDEFYEGAFWNEEFEALIMPLLERHEMVLVEDPGRLLDPVL